VFQLLTESSQRNGRTQCCLLYGKVSDHACCVQRQESSILKTVCTALRNRSHDGAVGIATPLRVGQPRNRSFTGNDKRFVFSLQIVQSGSEAHVVSCSVRTGVLFPTFKQPRYESEHSPLSSPEVKNEWSYTFLPPCAIIAYTGTTLPLPVLCAVKMSHLCF
jgi:hypothetical protein